MTSKPAEDAPVKPKEHPQAAVFFELAKLLAANPDAPLLSVWPSIEKGISAEVFPVGFPVELSPGDVPPNISAAWMAELARTLQENTVQFDHDGPRVIATFIGRANSVVFKVMRPVSDFPHGVGEMSVDELERFAHRKEETPEATAGDAPAVSDEDIESVEAAS